MGLKNDGTKRKLVRRNYLVFVDQEESLKSLQQSATKKLPADAAKLYIPSRIVRRAIDDFLTKPSIKKLLAK